MAEAYLQKFGGDKFHVESAGFEPAEQVNPLVVEVMKEEGIDLAAKKPQSVFGLYQQSEGDCPIFPGITRRWHIPFPDPAAAEGTHKEKLAKVREIRDAIKAMILSPPEGEFDFRKLS